MVILSLPKTVAILFLKGKLRSLFGLSACILFYQFYFRIRVINMVTLDVKGSEKCTQEFKFYVFYKNLHYGYLVFFILLLFFLNNVSFCCVCVCACAGECVCLPGWRSGDCSEPCEHDTFGYSCLQPCHCRNHATCRGTDGFCECLPGWMGPGCTQSMSN